MRDPSGNLQMSMSIDPNSPGGVKFGAPTPVNPEVKGAELAAQQNLNALGLSPDKFKNPDGSFNIAGANQAVTNSIGRPGLVGDPSKGIPAVTPNPASGLPADQAIAARHKELLDSQATVDATKPEIDALNRAKAGLQQFATINEGVNTGKFTNAEAIQTIGQAVQQAANLAVGTPTTWSTKNQELQAIGNSLVPELRDKSVTRVLASEIPWMTGNAPLPSNTKDANTVIINKAIPVLDDAINYRKYQTEFQAEKGTLVGADQAWQGFRQANPVFAPGTGLPSTTNETPAQYFTRTASDPTQTGKPAGAAGGAQTANPGGPAGSPSPKVTVDTSRQYSAAEIRALPSSALVQGTNGQWYHGLGAAQ
jgi:hypothetical protein